LTFQNGPEFQRGALRPLKQKEIRQFADYPTKRVILEIYMETTETTGPATPTKPSQDGAGLVSQNEVSPNVKASHPKLHVLRRGVALLFEKERTSKFHAGLPIQHV